MGQGERTISWKDHAGIWLKCLSFGRKPINSLHYRWYSCTNLHFENAFSPSGLPLPFTRSLYPRTVWKAAFHLWDSESSLLKEGLLECKFQRSKWGAISCFIVYLLHATLSLRCHQNKLLAREEMRGERETIPILKSIYFSKTTHIPLSPNWYLLIMCTT